MDKLHAQPKKKKRETQIPKKDFANFRLVYTSRDNKISIFADPDGHLCSVRTARLV